MKALMCALMCRCGGQVEVLHQTEEGDFVMYIITEKNTIIHRGICNRCGEGVTSERELITLFQMDADKKAN